MKVFRDDSWSDHALVSVVLQLPNAAAACPISSRAPKAAPRVLAELSTCDILTAEAIATVRTPSEATSALYGAGESGGTRVLVHVASSCKGAGRVDSAAAFGIYWGRESRFNCSLRIPGAQNDSRAALCGILKVVTSAPSNCNLTIHSTSKYAIHSFCHWAGENHTIGWVCANSDILVPAVEAMRRRSGSVHFIWIAVTDVGEAPTAARTLAVHCSSSNESLTFEIPTGPSGVNGEIDWGKNIPKCKVTTTLPEEEPPKPKVLSALTAEDLAIGEKRDAHRSRAKEREIQKTNLNRLINAESAREWWQVIVGSIDPVD